MGTSTSSKGGSAGSPFDPAWLNDEAGGDPAEAGDQGQGNEDQDGTADQQAPDEADHTDGAGSTAEGGGVDGAEAADAGQIGSKQAAPDRRFAAARSHMSNYLAGGGRDSLRTATRSMVTRGMGGARRAASTMRATSQGAGRLGQFLAAARAGTDQQVSDWVARVRAENLSAEDLILEIIGEVLPDSGSIDDEALRNASAEALGMLYEADPDVDVLDLSDQQIAEVIGHVIANDVCNRIDQQLGQTYERLKYDPHEIQVYRNDIKEFVRGEVQIVVRGIDARQLDPIRLAREVLSTALKVFSE